MSLLKTPAIIIAACLFTAMPALAYYSGGDQINNESDNTPFRIIVKVKSDISFSFTKDKVGKKSTGLQSFDAVSTSYSLDSQKFLFPEIKRRSLPSALKNVLIITPTDKADINALIEEYRNCPEVEYAEPDVYIELYSSPDDSHYQHQWYLNNTGQAHDMIEEHDHCNNDDELVSGVGAVDADIDADEVYNNPPANTTTSIVAILDTGVDIDHPDLADNIWVNTDEIPDNGIDDDYNGYIDDVKGWDFQGENGSSPDNDPTDIFGHGTHCAGIVGAVTGNGQGIAGAATDVQIMALRAVDFPFASSATEALIYAVDNNADVISMSFGLLEHSDLFESACQFAYNRGVTLVAAMGNDHGEELNEPAVYTTTIGVGATDHFDTVTSYSTYGNHISVVAPGDDILSLRGDLTDMYGDDPFCPETDAHVYDDIYYFSSGTSMAAPIVAAIASYLHAVSPGLNPIMTQQIIEQTSDDYTEPYGPEGPTGLDGWDIYSGYGRVNLNQALQNAPTTRAQIITPQNGGFHTDTIYIHGIADWDGSSFYTVEYGEGDEPGNWTEIKTSFSPVSFGELAGWNTDSLEGRYTIRLRVGDDHLDCVTISIASGCMAKIMSPSEGAEINSLTDIIGHGFCENGFDSVVLEYGMASPIIFGPGFGAVINTSTAPIINNVLGTWYSHDLNPGTYAIRSAVFFNDVIVVADTITVNMIPDFADENSTRTNVGAYTSPVANYGDFDFDGINEIVVGTSSGLVFLQPDGKLKTQGMPETPAENFLIPVAVGDINGDGLDDLVTVGGNPGMIYAFPSNEPPFMIPLTINFYTSGEANYTDETICNIIILEDIDADCNDEIIVNLSYYWTPQLIGVYDNDGTELWSTFNLDYRQVILSADLNGDGISEIYTCDDGGSIIKQRILEDTIINERNIQFGGHDVKMHNITAFDVDYDGYLEIVLTVASDNSDYYQFHALNFDLTDVTGWPHETPINDLYIPTNPIFTDLNEDGIFEYFVAVLALEQSYIYAYNVDGSPFLSDSEGLFSTTTEAGIINMLCVADIDGIGYAELVAIVNPDYLRSYRLQRMMAWDYNGDAIDGFPKITGMVVNGFSPSNPYEENYRHTPTIGDLDEDGILDLFSPVIDSELIITEFVGVSYDPSNVPVPSWRYNRGHTANGPTVEARLTTPADGEVIAGICNITGTANGPYLDYYTLEYGEGVDPDMWQQIASSSEPVDNGILGSWDVTALEGNYTLKLQVQQTQSQQNQSVTKNIFVANSPVASIINPIDNYTVWGIQETILPIIGSAICIDFDYAVVEYGEGLSPSEWFAIDTISIHAYESEITQWTASDLDTGAYTLRLSVYSTPGLEASDAVVIHRDQYFAGDNGWTAILNGDGGATANYGDFDGDNINEIIVGTSEGVYFYDLAGNPKTAGMPRFKIGDYRIPPAVGLLDGDTLDDFVIIGISRSQPILHAVLSSEPNFSVTLQALPHMEYFSPDAEYYSFMPQLYLKDIDDDGNDEIHYFTGGGNGTLDGKYYIYNSDGTPWTAFFPLEFTAYNFQAFPADINGDGLCEIYASGVSSGFLIKQYDTSGNVTNVFNLPTGNIPMSYSAVDINWDGKCELLSLIKHGSNKLYAFDDTLGVIEGWPIDLTTAYVPHPILADLNGDGFFEILTVHTENKKFMAWSLLDGTSYIPGADGVFAIPENPGTLHAPIVSDGDADGFADIICAVNGESPNYYAERFLAYNYNAELLEDYPIFTSNDTQPYEGNLHVPIAGDINEDGMLDILYISAERKLMFTNFSDRPYNQALTQVPMWRYNRRLNNTLESVPENWICGDADGDLVVAYDDIQYLIDFIYEEGPAPIPLRSGDLNGDCVINILDINYLSNFLYHSGPDPLCDCEPVIPPAAKANAVVGKKVGSAFCEEIDGEHNIVVNSDVPLSIVQLNLAGADDTKLSSTISGLQTWGTLTEGEGIIGIFDPTGKIQIGRGINIVLKSSSELEIRSAFACNINGDLVSLAIGKKGAGLGLPDHFALEQNYPNPFNPSTTISYDLPQISQVRIEIFNMLGQLVKTLIDKQQEAGSYQTIWDGQDENGHRVSSGIYFYKIVASEQIKTKKMILIK